MASRILCSAGCLLIEWQLGGTGGKVSGNQSGHGSAQGQAREHHQLELGGFQRRGAAKESAHEGTGQRDKTR